MYTLNIKTNSRFDMVDITYQIEKYISQENIVDGIVTIFIPHTTAGISLNENTDPCVQKDLMNIYNKMIPCDDNYTHNEGNSQAHALSSLISPSLTLIIDNGRLILGQWQNIYFMEYDGPRNRKAYIQTISKKQAENDK